MLRDDSVAVINTCMLNLYHPCLQEKGRDFIMGWLILSVWRLAGIPLQVQRLSGYLPHHGRADILTQTLIPEATPAFGSGSDSNSVKHIHCGGLSA